MLPELFASELDQAGIKSIRKIPSPALALL